MLRIHDAYTNQIFHLVARRARADTIEGQSVISFFDETAESLRVECSAMGVRVKPRESKQHFR